MIKKTIEISRQPVFLSTKLGQLVVKPVDEDDARPRTIPCEDIGVLIIDEPRCTLTAGALRAVLAHGAVVVVCGHDHMPAGTMLPTSSNNEQVTRLREQIEASKPRMKRLWQQVIRAKARNQAACWPEDSDAHGRLLNLAREVKSGDATNIEAQAGRVHWKAWRKDIESLQSFKRDPDGEDIANGLLNYGYAALRAAVARALVSAGLHPALGIHHHNRANAFCLADDLMEPLRPAVDRRARMLMADGAESIDQQAKAQLLEVLIDEVELEGQTGPLMVALPRVTASLVRCLRGEDKELRLPALAAPAGMPGLVEAEG